jgi:ABC-type lipoprotein release transport system permease subunit
MNPISPLTYYRRHKRSALLQIALISLATVGLFVLVAVLDVMPERGKVSYLTKMSRVTPAGSALEPGVVAKLQTHPDIAYTIRDNGLPFSAPTLIGRDGLHLLGVSPEDARELMQHCDVRLKEGRMFQPRSNEIVLSEQSARALQLQIGDEISRAVDKRYYEAVATPLVLVGILESDPGANQGPSVRLGFASFEYLSSHEAFAPRKTSLIVIAKPGRKEAVDAFLEIEIATQYTHVETFAEIARYVNLGHTMLYVIFGIVNSVVSVVMAFVVGVINQIALSNRLDELGLLHALGLHKRQLTRRMTAETAVAAGIGTLIGMGLALLVMSALKLTLFYNLGMELNLLNPAPFGFVLPTPVIVVALAFHSVRRTFAQLDAVAIVERGQLSMEESAGQSAAMRSPGSRSGIRPLSSLTFYRRHRRRGVVMVLSIAMTVLGVALPVFLLSAMSGALKPQITYLEYVSQVYAPANSKLDPGTVAQIKSHPAVWQVIPSIQLGIQMMVPPGAETSIGIYGVSEADMATLMETFGVGVQEGRLPRSRSNEIVLSSSIAANRGLHVGDVVGGDGNADDSLISDDIPIEMLVVGLLAPSHPWIGFASLEYLESHELVSARSPRLLLIAHQGRKSEMDRWLQESIASDQASVTTYATAHRSFREFTTSMALTFVLLECMIAAVAVVAMATLNTIFFSQRKQEFGVLNAIGRSRWWLVGRTAKETGSVTALAWLIGAGLCGIGLLSMQTLLYAPRGLSLDFLNPTPWIFTTPLPLSIVLTSVSTIAWMLSRLDPVTVIEKR